MISKPALKISRGQLQTVTEMALAMQIARDSVRQVKESALASALREILQAIKDGRKIEIGD